HTRYRGDAAIPRGLGFRGGEKPPLPFVEMRQDRRFALLERIFIDHLQRLRCPTPLGNPLSIAVKPHPIQLLSDGPLVVTKPISRSAKTHRPSAWVPAFAGTTLGRQIRHHRIEQRKSGLRDPQPPAF